MNLFTAEAFAGALALIGVVIIFAALLSGAIERSNVPQVAIFLLLGLALGENAFGVLHVGLDSPVLRVTSTLSLVLVLFTDALALSIAEVKRYAGLAARVLGPGSILSSIIIAAAAYFLLDLPATHAVMLGAALASTDPVMLRGLLRRTDIPANARQALHLESGLNDVVLLPIVVIAMSLAERATHGETSFGRIAVQQFLLGPGAGILVGFVAVVTLDFVRKRIGVRRDYESIYSIGVAFAAFAAAEAAHGSGFLAAFAAGLTIAWLDVELCDCFLDYGGATAELLLLFTFVLFGASLIWTGLSELSLPTILFAVITLLIRLPVYFLSLAGSGVEREGKLLIAWFGPRGLSSLLLILLPVFAGIENSNRLFALCSLVVLMSIVIHGGSTFFFSRFWSSKTKMNDEVITSGQATIEHETFAPQGADAEAMNAQRQLGNHNQTLATQAADTSSNDNAKSLDDNVADKVVTDNLTITLEEVSRLRQANQNTLLLDVRTARSREPSTTQAVGSVRLNPDTVRAALSRRPLPADAWLVAYCA